MGREERVRENGSVSREKIVGRKEGGGEKTNEE